MTRQLLTLTFPIFVLGAACGPAPLRPRGAVEPPPDPAPADAHASPSEARDGGGEPRAIVDAGTPTSADAGSPRPKLPAPDAAVTDAPDAGAADAGAADAAVADAGAAGGDVEVGSVPAPAAGELRIVEVLVNPAGQDVGREWIEILSLAPEPRDLAALHLADTAADVAAPAGIIAPGARLLLGQLSDGSKNGGAPVAVAYGTRLALNNDGEEISICVGACATGAVIDRVAWGALGAAYDGHALVFDREASLTCAATQPFGTAGDFGTPGEPNPSCLDADGGR